MKCAGVCLSTLGAPEAPLRVQLRIMFAMRRRPFFASALSLPRASKNLRQRSRPAPPRQATPPCFTTNSACSTASSKRVALKSPRA